MSRIKGKLSDEELSRRTHYVDLMYSLPNISEPESENYDEVTTTHSS